MNFDLNQHFKKFSHNLFYDQKSYFDLNSDLSAFCRVLQDSTSDSTVGLQLRSPYLAMVALLAAHVTGKTAVMLSYLEADVMIEKLKNQIEFDFIIKDSIFENLNLEKKFFFPAITPEAISVIVFSSGTSSLPKGIALNFKNLYYSALGFSQFFKQHEKETSLINLPHHHVGGMMILWRAFFSGGKIVTDFQAPIDFISLVPLQLKRMLADQAKLELLKKIRVILVGGAALTASLKKEAENLGLKLYETYGMSETASLIMINGEVLPYRELKLDEASFFNIKGETLCSGYFINQTFTPIKAEWFKTNDIGKMTTDGKFKFVERADLIFISGGENINPLLVEEVAKQNPDITDAYLIPIPDEEWGDLGVLIYTPSHPLQNSVEELNAQLKIFLRERLYPHFIPKFFFPTTLTFEGQLKPKRSELKALALELYLKSIFSYDFIPNTNDQSPVLVLFHGFLGDKEDLVEVTQTLRADYSLLFIDLPGHGKTIIENFHSLDDLLQKLAKLIRLFSSTPSYYGYSMGGRVALQLALSYLPPVQLFLESAAIGLKDEEEKNNRTIADQFLFEGINQKQIKNFLNNWYAHPMFKTYSALSIFNKDCDKKSQHDLSQWRKSQNILSVGVFPIYSKVIEEIKKLDLEIIYLYGEEDQKYKAIAHLLLKASIRRLKLIEFLGAGHNPHKSHPVEITQTLTMNLKF